MDHMEMFQALRPLVNIENFRLASHFDVQATSAFLRPNAKLAHAVANSKAKGLPPISVVPLSG